MGEEKGEQIRAGGVQKNYLSIVIRILILHTEAGRAGLGTPAERIQPYYGIKMLKLGKKKASRAKTDSTSWVTETKRDVRSSGLHSYLRWVKFQPTHQVFNRGLKL